MDIVDLETRSRMMAGIGGKNTKPEILLRKALFARGLRYRLHQSALPGKPDLVFQRFKSVVFVHGCFWHQHSCPLFRMPTSNTAFWKDKIDRNVSRDVRQVGKLREAGWRVAVVWECSLDKKGLGVDEVSRQVENWLKGTDSSLEIPTGAAP